MTLTRLTLKCTDTGNILVTSLPKTTKNEDTKMWWKAHMKGKTWYNAPPKDPSFLKKLLLRYKIENANLKKCWPHCKRIWVCWHCSQNDTLLCYTEHFRHGAYYLVPNWEIWFWGFNIRFMPFKNYFNKTENTENGKKLRKLIHQNKFYRFSAVPVGPNSRLSSSSLDILYVRS